MAYDLENLKNNKGGATLENSDKAPTPGGVYRHPETGVEVTTLSDPLYGDVQSEGLVRVGFEYVGPAPEGSVKSIVEVILDEKSKDNSTAGLASRIAALEGVKDNLAAEQAKNAELQKQLDALLLKDRQTVESGEDAKAEAEKQTDARGPENTPDVNTGVNQTEKKGK